MVGTYTVVYKDYPAANIAEALALCFRDPSIWTLVGPWTGENNGYCLHSWEWTPDPVTPNPEAPAGSPEWRGETLRGNLRAWFR